MLAMCARARFARLQGDGQSPIADPQLRRKRALHVAMRRLDCQRQAVSASDSKDSAELSPGTWPSAPADAGHDRGLGGSVLEILLQRGDESL